MLVFLNPFNLQVTRWGVSCPTASRLIKRRSVPLALTASPAELAVSPHRQQNMSPCSSFPEKIIRKYRSAALSKLFNIFQFNIKTSSLRWTPLTRHMMSLIVGAVWNALHMSSFTIISLWFDSASSVYEANLKQISLSEAISASFLTSEQDWIFFWGVLYHKCLLGFHTHLSMCPTIIKSSFFKNLHSVSTCGAYFFTDRPSV